MNKAAKKIKQALIARYKAPTVAVPIAIRERPLRTQFRAFMKDAAEGARPLPMMPDQGMQQNAMADPMMVAQLLGGALDQGGLPDPMDMMGMGAEAGMMGAGQAQPGGAMGPQAAPQASMGPMMAGERLPPSPGAAQAATATPAQAGPGIDHRQILAALFGA